MTQQNSSNCVIEAVQLNALHRRHDTQNNGNLHNNIQSRVGMLSGIGLSLRMLNFVVLSVEIKPIKWGLLFQVTFGQVSFCKVS